MIVLGISAHYHDSACALVIDGRPAFALQEERLSRRRFDRALPRRAILAGLRELRLHPADIDVIAYYEDPVAKLSRQLATGALGRRPGEASGFEAAGDLDPRRPVAEIRDFLGWDGTVTVLRHHESHAAAGYFTSGFATAALFTADAVGEWDTTAFGFAEGSDLSTVATVQFPHSLGIFYSAITDYLGFEVNSDEFKVMGLASYGEPTRAGEMSRIVHRTGVLSFATDPRFLDVLGTRHMYREALTGLLGEPPLEPGAPPGPAHADIASSAAHA